MLYSLKYISLRTACLLMAATFCLGVFIGKLQMTDVVYPEQANDVVKTVAHLSIRNPNFELLASFPDEDVAYYRRLGQLQTVKVGEDVYTYTGSPAVVTDIGINGFTIRCESLTIGDSGTVIRNSDEAQVGYVSQQVGDNLFYCIWS